MATINRFNKFTGRDYNMDWYVPQLASPNFEAWNEVLAGEQNTYDTANAFLTSKNPRYLQTEEDRAIYQQYRDFANKAVDDISKAYQEQGISGGKRLMNNYASQIAKEWQPGGRAHLLEDRFTGYASAREEIEKAFKDGKSPVNKEYAYNLLNQQLNSPVKYDPNTGQYTRISTPELYQDPNIREQVLQAIDKIKESGDTSIVALNPYWYEKIKREGRSAETIEAVTKAMLDQPEFAKQVGIEAWYKGRQYNPEEVQQRYVSNLDSAVKDLETKASKLNTLSKDEIKSIQQQLGVTPDGVAGPQTKQAFNDYIAEQKDKANKAKEGFNYDSFMSEQVRKSYVDFARGFANQKVDKDLIFNQAEKLKQEIAARNRQTQALLDISQSLRPVTNSEALATPDTGRNLEDYLRAKKNAEQNFQQAEQSKNTLLKKAVDAKAPNGAKFADVFGTDTNNIATIMSLYSASGGDESKFFKLVSKNPGLKDYTTPQLRQAFNLMTTQGTGIKETFDAYQLADRSRALYQENEMGITQTYIQNEGREDWNKLQRFRKPGESDEDFLRAVINKDSRFNNQTTDPRYNPYSAPSLNPVINSADLFLNKRDNTVSKSTNPEYQKSVNTYSITAASGDPYLGTLDRLVQSDLANGDFTGYVSEGKQGLTFRNKNGSEVSAADIKNAHVEITTMADSGAGYKITGTVKQGKNEVPVVAYTDQIPVTHIDAAKIALTGTRAEAKQKGDNKLAQVATVALAGVNGYDYSKAAAENAIKLNAGNMERLTFVIPSVDKSGNIVGANGTAAERGITGGMLLDEFQAQDGRTYRKYKVQDKTGNQKFARVQVRYDNNGNELGEILVPNQSGGYWYSNSQDIDFEQIGKSYDLNVPVETNIQKVPQGRVMSEAEKAALNATLNTTNNGEDSD